MRILLVNDYKDVIGGTEVYMWSIKEFLEKRGHIVRIYSSNKSKEEYIISQQNKSLLLYLKKIFNLNAYFNFKIIVSEFQPDIIHLQNIYNELSPSILLATKAIPVMMTVHDSQLVNPVSILSERTGRECKKRTCSGCMNCVGWKGAIYEKIKRKIHKILFKKISLFITPSQYMRDLIREAGFYSVTVIPNGIKQSNYYKIDNFNKLLYVGRITKDKGIIYLLSAMPEIIKNFPDIELQLVGDGTDKDYLISMTKKLHINDNIKFVGAVSRNEIFNYYKESTILVVPSVYPDNFPTVCIEAMSMGRPIVGTSMGGIPELVYDGKSGFLVEPYNSRQLEEKIIELLSDKTLLMQKSEYARKKATLYTLDIHVNKIIKQYKKLVYSNTV